MENNNNQDFNLSQAFRDIRADADSILYTSNKRQATEFACAAQIIVLSDEEYKLLPQNLKSFCDKGLNEVKANLQIISKRKNYINKVQPTDNIYFECIFMCPNTTCFKKDFGDAAYEGFFSNRVEANFKIEMKQAMIDTTRRN
jgi:arabinogalactan endo-1,4-beta-galactosidase